FFQAEDGIRDFHVTGVQTCALPISRSANCRFRSSRERIRSGRGGKRPKLAFIGWKCFGSAVVMYRARLPIAVSGGKTTGSLPMAKRAALIPAISPDAADST